MAQVAPSPRPSSRNSFRSSSPSAVPSALPRPSSRISSGTDVLPLPPPTSFSPPESSTPQRPSRPTRRRSSYDALAHLSASKDPSIESLIPLPTRTPLTAEAIHEGVPLEFTVKSPETPSADGRPYTPTRTLSRIPVSAVGNARALTDDGRPRSVSPFPPTPLTGDVSLDLSNVSSSLIPGTPSSGNGYKRLSLSGGGTSKVLSDLQTAAVHARTALDNTRQQLRLSQRSVASLTRQVEDLKDGRERLRLENESLNNVVARKERLLQEVLERARKAESEAVTLKTQLKTEVAASKKSVSTVSEAVAQSQKAQREYTTLRDSISGMTQGWKDEVKALKDEMKQRDEAWREEVKEVSVKYGSLVKLVKASNTERGRIDAMKKETVVVDNKFEATMREEIKKLSKEIHKSAQGADEAGKQANDLAEQLQHLRTMMRTAGSAKLHAETR